MRLSISFVLLTAACGARSAPGGAGGSDQVLPDAATRPRRDSAVRVDAPPVIRPDAARPRRDSWPLPPDAAIVRDLRPPPLDVARAGCGGSLQCAVGCLNIGGVDEVIACIEVCIANLCESGRDPMVTLLNCALANCLSCVDGDIDACFVCLYDECDQEIQSCVSHTCY